MKQSGKNTWSIPTLGQQFGWYRLSTHRRQLTQNAADWRRFAFRSWDYFLYIRMSVGNDSQISVGSSGQVRGTMPAVTQDTGAFTPARHVRTGESSLVALRPHSAMLEFCSFLHLQFWDERCSAWGRLVLFSWALGQLVAIFGKSHWELGVAKQLSPWELQSLE